MKKDYKWNWIFSPRQVAGQMSPSPSQSLSDDCQTQNPLKSLSLFQDLRDIVWNISNFGITSFFAPKMESLMLCKKLKSYLVTKNNKIDYILFNLNWNYRASSHFYL
jgi:hypothetical protein